MVGTGKKRGHEDYPLIYTSPGQIHFSMNFSKGLAVGLLVPRQGLLLGYETLAYPVPLSGRHQGMKPYLKPWMIR